MHTGRVEQVFFLLPHLEYLRNPRRLYSVCIRIFFLGYKVISTKHMSLYCVYLVVCWRVWDWKVDWSVKANKINRFVFFFPPQQNL